MSDGSRARVTRIIAWATALAVLSAGAAYALVSGFSEDGDTRQVATGARPSTTGVRPTSTDPTSTTTTTTTPQETTTTTEAPPPPEPDGAMLELQQGLLKLGYDVGQPDGFPGWRTYYAILAFQKVEGLARTGEDNAEVRDALTWATRPGPMVPGGASTRVEIDLNRQVLFLWQGGDLARILPVSTGNGERYCVEGECDVAVTPTGTFRIGRKARGLEISRLGELYDPMYFYGGIAIHGSPHVPGYAASHGCVRIPLYASPTFFDQVPAGTAVYVVGDGPAATDVPPPPDEPVVVPPPPVPPEPEPDPTTTTTTTPPDPSTTMPPLTVPEDETGDEATDETTTVP
jgi:peptidoglycan hydrolase-like protein with peptidoglycan-binding domain